MMRSFFGGDPRIEHYSVALRPIRSAPHGTYQERAQARRERSARFDELKALGFKTPYFQFPKGDKVAEAKAKAKAEAFAERWQAKTGFELVVEVGCFL